MKTIEHPFKIVEWNNDQAILLDQRLLPETETYVTVTSSDQMAECIQNMTVRGAPAIGVAAAFGMALATLEFKGSSYDDYATHMQKAYDKLFATRPTAVNLVWGLNRIQSYIQDHSQTNLNELKQAVIDLAIQIQKDDIHANQMIGDHGHVVFEDGDTILTHCNAGALATAGHGTALGVIYSAVAHGKHLKVYADETRPVLQGARLTAWELNKHNIDVTVISDNMAASLMAKGKIDKIIVGADRIAANGDVANKIGTYAVAICAKHHNIPFYVAAPFSTIDPQTPTGNEIPIEERDHSEIHTVGNRRLTPVGVNHFNPGFDVTPSKLVSGIITEKGIFEFPYSF